MSQPTRNWYFEPDPVPERAWSAADDDGAAPTLTCVPGAVLQRHGARLLNPSDAPAIPGSGRDGWARAPRSTAYRARTLLIPADLLRDDAVVRAMNSALAPVGMSIVLPSLDSRRTRSEGRVAEALGLLPRIAGLVPAEPKPGRPALPVVIDAWTALQALRAAADATEKAHANAEKATSDAERASTEAERPDGDAERGNTDVAERAGTGAEGAAPANEVALTSEIVRRITLEHVLAGSAVTMNASVQVSDITGSPSTEGNGLTGPGSTDSYVYGGGDTRAPVAVFLRAPARRKPESLGGRRPVVAVLDTGVRAHPWLDVWPDPAGGYTVDEADGFVMDDPVIQAALYEEGRYAADEQGDRSRHAIKGAWDTPISADPLIGELDDATGHGTFIAGIVRQAAPDARVLSIRIMHSDSVVYEGDLLCALALLADRIAAARERGTPEAVDVVSLSLGYFDESPADVAYGSGLWQVIRLLLDMGVAVVAAAGNYSTSRRFYPAAFSLQPSPVPLISVGALNPNGSKALFSDGGRWVRAWAAGAAVVSTYPDDINGSRTPEVRVPAHPDNALPPEPHRPDDREALDPDDYHGGFATWSGTSFAAPLIAARIAGALLERAAGQGAVPGRPAEETATDRTLAALEALGWPGRS